MILSGFLELSKGFHKAFKEFIVFLSMGPERMWGSGLGFGRWDFKVVLGL